MPGMDGAVSVACGCWLTTPLQAACHVRLPHCVPTPPEPGSQGRVGIAVALAAVAAPERRSARQPDQQDGEEDDAAGAEDHLGPEDLVVLESRRSAGRAWCAVCWESAVPQAGALRHQPNKGSTHRGHHVFEVELGDSPQPGPGEWAQLMASATHTVSCGGGREGSGILRMQLGRWVLPIAAPTKHTRACS